MSWEEKKAAGNKAFGQGEFSAAISSYSEAIALDPDNHVLFSNRAAAFLSKRDYNEALTDGLRCVDLNASFPKGYSRCAQAMRGLGQLEEAIAILKTGEKLLEKDSNSPLRGELGEMMSMGSDYENSNRLEASGLAKYKQAEPALASAAKDLQRALGLRKKVVGDQNPLLHTLANNVRGVLKAQGEEALAQKNVSEAKRCFHEAITCTAMAFGAEGVACAVLRSKLAQVLGTEGDVEGAFELLFHNKVVYEKLYKELHSQPALEHPSAAAAAEAAEEREIQIHSQAQNLVALGTVTERRGERARAIDFVKEALTVRRCESTSSDGTRVPAANGPAQQKDEMTILQNLAYLQNHNAQYEEAGNSLEQALGLHTGLLKGAQEGSGSSAGGAGEEVVGDSLSITLLRDLGVAAWQVGGKTTAALGYFSRSHKLCTVVHGVGHADTAAAALKVGAVLIQMQRWEDAETVLTTAADVLGKWRSASGAAHPQAKVAHDNLQIAIHKGKS
jgi:tetratricopeptide (TPR) repeat protein